MRKILAVERDDLPADTTAETPPGFSNIIVEVMTPAGVILVRVLRTYFQAVLGFATAALVAPAIPVLSDVLPPAQLGELLVACFLAGLGPAAISALQNIVELLAKLDEARPELRA